MLSLPIILLLASGQTGSQVRSIAGEGDGKKRVYMIQSNETEPRADAVVEEYTCPGEVPASNDEVKAGCQQSGAANWDKIDAALVAAKFDQAAVRTLVFKAIARKDGAPQPFAKDKLAELFTVVFKVFHPDQQPTEAEILAGLLGGATSASQPASQPAPKAPDLTDKHYFDIVNCHFPSQLFGANLGVSAEQSLTDDETLQCSVEVVFTTPNSAEVYIQRFNSYQGPTYSRQAQAKVQLKYLGDETGWSNFEATITQPDGKVVTTSRLLDDKPIPANIFFEPEERLRIDFNDFFKPSMETSNLSKQVRRNFTCLDIFDLHCDRYKQPDGRQCKNVHTDINDNRQQCGVGNAAPAAGGNGLVPCSQPMPKFIEGGECCADGFWHANDGELGTACKGIGKAKCKGSGQFGVCTGAGKVPMPKFFEGGDCCADGCWHANDGQAGTACNGVGGGSGGSGGGGGGGGSAANGGFPNGSHCSQASRGTFRYMSGQKAVIDGDMVFQFMLAPSSSGNPLFTPGNSYSIRGYLQGNTLFWCGN